MNQTSISLTAEQKEKILRDMWIVHDSRWFIKTVIEQGYEKATEMNINVVKSFAKFEMKRLLQEINYQGVRTIEDLKNLLNLMGDITYPDGCKPDLKVKDESSILAHVSGCFIYDNVNKAGFQDIHICTAYARCSSWFKVLGLDGDVVTDGTTKTCKGECNLVFIVNRFHNGHIS